MTLFMHNFIQINTHVQKLRGCLKTLMGPLSLPSQFCPVLGKKESTNSNPLVNLVTP